MITLSVFCTTYNRPHLLGELIESFRRQTYPKDRCELVVLDDAGQYGDLRGENWQVVSLARRFASLGEKRNACVSLTNPRFTHLVITDDDDIYLPWWLECHAENFASGARWSYASAAYWSEENRIEKHWQDRDNPCFMHPGHAFEKALFWKMGGYPHLSGWEDRDMFLQFVKRGFRPRDALETGYDPYLIYRRFRAERHLTEVPLERYQREFVAKLPKAELAIGWQRDYLTDVAEFRKFSVDQSNR